MALPSGLLSSTTTLTTRWTLQLPPAVVKVVKSPSRSFPRLQSLWSSTLLPSRSVQRRQSQPHRIQVGWLSLLLPILRTSRPPYPKTPPHLPNPFIIKDVVACFLGRSCLGRRWLTLGSRIFARTLYVFISDASNIALSPTVYIIEVVEDILVYSQAVV